MTIQRITLGTLVAASFLALSAPAFAGNDSDRDRPTRQEVTEFTYSGSEEPVMPQAPTASYDEPVTIMRDKGNNPRR
jgi:hypothetical protein